MRYFASLALVGLLAVVGCCSDTGWQHAVPRPSWGPHSTGPVIHPDCPHCKPISGGRSHAHCCGEYDCAAAAGSCDPCRPARSACGGH